MYYFSLQGDQFLLNLKLITCGAQGYIYKGEYENQVVIIKIPKDDQESKVAFKNEQECIINLKHYNIIKVYCKGDNGHLTHIKKQQNSQQQIPYMIMQYAEQTVLDLKHSNERIVRYLFQQLMCGIEYLHKIGMTHLDLKLTNILIVNQYELKIADFGLARTTVSLLDSFQGSQPFIAPEIYYCEDNEGSQQDDKYLYDGYKADIYSCGVILLCLIINQGTPYFEEATLDDQTYRLIMLEKIDQFFVRIEKLSNVNISQNLQNLVQKMITHDFTKRISIESIKKHPFYLNDDIAAKEEVQAAF